MPDFSRATRSILYVIRILAPFVGRTSIRIREGIAQNGRNERDLHRVISLITKNKVYTEMGVEVEMRMQMQKQMEILCR